MKKPPLLFLGLFFFSALGCTGPKKAQIVTYDQICLPGEQIKLQAKLESTGIIKNNIKKEAIEFYDASGNLIGSGITQKEGVVEIPYHVGKEGFIQISAQLNSNKYQAQSSLLLIGCSPPETKFIVVDIDNTISNLSPILMLFYENIHIAPVKGAAETLQQLSKKYTLIYMTGRDISLALKTKAWLKQNGFPQGPVFFWDFLHTPLSKKKYKSELIDQIGRKFELIQIGIGNSVSDAVAYISNGLTALILLTDEEKKRSDQLPRGARIVSNWAEIQRLLY